MSREQQNISVRLAGSSSGIDGIVGEGDSVTSVGPDSGGNGSDLASANPGTIVIDPDELSGSGNGSSGDAGPGEPERRRRGRKPGSRNSSPKKAAALDINGLELMLFSTHAMLAALTSTEELGIDKDEAKTLAEAAAAVGRHYDMNVPAKTVDWYNLIMVAGTVYGPRISFLISKGRNRRAPAPKVETIIDVPKPLKARPAAPAPAPKPAAPKSDDGMVDIPGIGRIQRMN